MAAFTALAIALWAGSTAVQVAGNIKAGRAAKAAGVANREAAESQASLADYNAAVADLQADDAVARGVAEEGRFRAQVRGLIGTQRAAFAASNIDVSYGSAVDVQADAARLGELDALTIRTNALREAWGFKVEANDLRERAKIARKEGVYLEAAGRAQQTQYKLAAVGAIASGSSSLLMARYGFGRTAAAA